MATAGKYCTAQRRGKTCCVNLGVIHLETREGSDKTKFHREQTQIKKRSSPLAGPWGTPTLGSRGGAASRRDGEGGRVTDGETLREYDPRKQSGESGTSNGGGKVLLGSYQRQL